MSGFLFGPPDPEAMAEMREQYEQRRAHAIDFQHTLEEAWTQLDYDQQTAVAQWMLYTSEGSEQTMRVKLGYMAGSLFRLASEIGDKCMVCDLDHDEEINALLPTAPAAEEPRVKTPDELVKDAEAEAAYAKSLEMVREHEANLLKYELVQDFEKGGFKCFNCGMPSPSLEDRMMKPAGREGCPGCIQKAKWG